MLRRNWLVSTLVLASILFATSLPGCNELRVLIPARSYESTPPVLPENLQRPAVLVYSKTNGFRHADAISAGVVLFEKLTDAWGWSMFHTENGAVHNPEQLSHFDVIVWHNTSGDTLKPQQEEALKAWIQTGGGFIAIHGAGGDQSYEWQWYLEHLLRAQFIGHPMGPQFQDATLRTEDRTHPATRNLPDEWVHNEEWYSFSESPRGKGVKVLLSVDESTYDPRFKMLWMNDDLSMGEDHPVAWYHCEGPGRVLYSALGHQASSYELPQMSALLSGALMWAAGHDGPSCPDSSDS